MWASCVARSMSSLAPSSFELTFLPGHQFRFQLMMQGVLPVGVFAHDGQNKTAQGVEQEALANQGANGIRDA